MMSTKLHKVVVSTLIAGLVAVLSVPSAEAARGGDPDYVPPVTVPDDDDYEDDDYEYEDDDDDIDGDVLGEVIDAGGPDQGPDVLGNNLTNPQTGGSGGGDPSDSAPEATSTTPPAVAADDSSRPEPHASVRGGILSRTGSEAMPLVRAGLAALVLGGGLVVLSRRRRYGAASA